MKEYAKVSILHGDVLQGSCISEIDSWQDSIAEDLRQLAVGDSFKITKIELTEEQYNNLGDFEGF